MGLALSHFGGEASEEGSTVGKQCQQGEQVQAVLAKSLPVRVLRCASSTGQRKDLQFGVRRQSEDCSQQQCRPKVVVPRRARSNTSSLKAEAGSRARDEEEEEEGAGSSEEAEAQPAFAVENIVNKMRELLQPCSHLEAKLQNLSTETRSSLGRTCPLPLFALALGGPAARMGCRLAVRRVLGRIYWSSCMGSSFIVCALPSGSHAQRPEQACIIISPGFRDIFSTPHMTPRYRQVWSTLPDIFVGHVDNLVPLLRLLCYELTLMFEALGQHLPPWRSFEVLASRWMSSSCEDVVVPVAGLQPSTRMEVGLFLAETKKLMEGQPVQSCSKPKQPPTEDQRMHAGVVTRPAAHIPGLPGARAVLHPRPAVTVTTGFSIRAASAEQEER